MLSVRHRGRAFGEAEKKWGGVCKTERAPSVFNATRSVQHTSRCLTPIQNDFAVNDRYTHLSTGTVHHSIILIIKNLLTNPNFQL